MSIVLRIINIWKYTGLTNFAFIASVNWYNMIIKTYKEPFISNPTEPIDHAINSVAFICKSLSFSAICMAKGFLFGLAGPIGSYRIGLGFYNRKLTGDNGWTQVLCQLSGYKHAKYTTKPFGYASWMPVRN